MPEFVIPEHVIEEQLADEPFVVEIPAAGKWAKPVSYTVTLSTNRPFFLDMSRKDAENIADNISVSETLDMMASYITDSQAEQFRDHLKEALLAGRIGLIGVYEMHDWIMKQRQELISKATEAELGRPTGEPLSSTE